MISTDKSMGREMRGGFALFGRPFALFAALVCVLAIAGCGKTKTVGTSVIKVGVIPFEDITKIQENYKPFAEYIGKKCGGRPAEVFVTPEYAGVMQALRSDQIDCAYLNPLSYALAVQEFKDTPERLIPLAMPIFHGKPTYQGIIFARADSGISSLKDFKGKSFAFGDRTSTSGYLYPAAMFKQIGIDPNRDLRGTNITGPAGVLAVFNKQVDGGASFEGIIEMALKDAAQAKQMKVVAKTDPIPNGMFVARGNLDPAEIAQLKAALVSINTETDGKAALKSMEYDSWIPADDSAFDSVRKTATVLDLHLSSLDQPKTKPK